MPVMISRDNPDELYHRMVNCQSAKLRGEISSLDCTLLSAEDAISRLSDARIGKGTLQAKRRKGVRRVGHAAGKSLGLGADLLKQCDGLLQVVKSVEPRIGGIVYGSLVVVLKVSKCLCIKP
jgi:hypothetical protein